jgi:glycosyltransferase involved in cell wall biosynthesis
MRVVIDARPAVEPRPTGVGRYVDRLVRTLPAVDPDADYVAWSVRTRGILRPATSFDDVAGLEERVSPIPRRLFEPLASRLGWPRLRAVGDVLLATNYAPPPVTDPGPLVVVVHDVAFERHPETAPHVDERWRRSFRRALSRAGGVIAPSSATRDDLEALLGVDPARVDVVPLGADRFAAPAPGAVDAVRRSLGVPDGPVVLWVGGIESRKNLEALVGAFGRVAADQDGSLVLAGGTVPWDRDAATRVETAIERLPASIRPRVVRTGYVERPQKAALLAAATVLAYPSLAEGFGLPILEGFAAGVPVLTSDASSMPEVAGDAALLVTPREDSIAEGLGRLLADAQLREGLVARGADRARSFTWERCARATAAVLHRVGGSASGPPVG